MTQTSEFGGKQGFGQEGSPGALSPFDIRAAQMGAERAGRATINRYAQLGLSAQGATPTSPGGAAGGIGVANIGTQGGPNPNAQPGFGTAPGVGPGGGILPSFADVNAMPTAEQMDLGQAPSLVGGIPAEFEAMLGQLQTEDLSLTSQMANSGGGGGKGGKGGGGLGALGGLAKMGGK